MKRRHRVATALLAGIGAVALAACGDDESTTTEIDETVENAAPAPAPDTTPAEPIEPTTDTTPTTTDTTDTTTTGTTTTGTSGG